MVSILYKVLTSNTYKMDLLIPWIFACVLEVSSERPRFHETENHWYNHPAPPSSLKCQRIKEKEMEGLNYFNDSFKYPLPMACVRSLLVWGRIKCRLSLVLGYTILCCVTWQTEFWYHNILRIRGNCDARMEIMCFLK